MWPLDKHGAEAGSDPGGGRGHQEAPDGLPRPPPAPLPPLRLRSVAIAIVSESEIVIHCVTSDVSGVSFSSRYPNTVAHLKRDAEETDFDDDEDEESGALVIKEEGQTEETPGYSSPGTGSTTTCK